MTFGLSDKTRYSMQRVFALYPELDKVIIYGSRAKGNYRPGSDIDLTLLGLSLGDSILSKVLVDLDDLNTPYFMDISLFDQIESQVLLEHIQRVGQVFYDRGSFKSVDCVCKEGGI